jgi:signal peptidase II
MSRGSVPLGRWVLFWAIALGGAAFDLAAKARIFFLVGQPGAPAKPLIPDVLELRTSHNRGALWGLGNHFEHSSLIFAALSILAAAAILWWLFARGAAADRRLTVALALIMAGALGNCYDRLRFGYVRDFVHFHVDPIGFDCAIFNFADNMLVIGAVSLMLLALRPESPAEPGPSGEPATREQARAIS